MPTFEEIELDEYPRGGGPRGLDGELDLTVLQWTRGKPLGQFAQTRRVGALQYCQPCDLTVIFTELDYPTPKNSQGLSALFEYYQFPAAFQDERSRSVSQSYGEHSSTTGAQCSWFHSLCKNINVKRRQTADDFRDMYEIVNPNHNSKLGQSLQQDDNSWLSSAYFLKREPRSSSNTDAESHDDSHTAQCVTLICFGPPKSLADRFLRLPELKFWEDVLEDPYLLFPIVVDELFKQFDQTTWNLGMVFSGIEYGTLAHATQPGGAVANVDFVALHNVSRHITYLNEAGQAILLTLENMQSCYRQNQVQGHRGAATQEAFRYRKGLFQSTQLRLKSLEQRMQNVQTLSFNLVTQQDSRVLQRDSSSMHTIAIVTLLFLPITTIASIFDTQFFDFLGNGNISRTRVSPYFWIFWVIAVPVTGLVIAVWWFYHRRAETRRRPASEKVRQSTWHRTSSVV